MRLKKLLLLAFSALLVVVLAACSGGEDPEGIISAKDWEADHPDIYATYLRNSEMAATTFGGSEPIDYLEKYPYLRTLYDGVGFSIEYLRARGHLYALEDVIHTERPKPGASCLSCKTSGFLEILDEHGLAGNAMSFAEAVEREMETVSCYDCHRNEPGVLHVTREHLNVALEGIDQEFQPKDLACAQCHVEYYLHPDTKEVIMPSVNGLDVDSMMAYFDDLGYFDWVHPRSGTELLKVQHPEWETYQGSVHARFNLSCTDCHMPETERADGTTFPSHHWTSPLKTIEASCLGCHRDDTGPSLTARVEGIQGAVEEKMNDTAWLIVELIEELERASADGTAEAVLLEARAKHRAAQWYWDFVFVENGEGFHNRELAHRLLDDARTLTEEALALLR